MSYTPLSETFRTVSITHGATSLPDPIGGSMDSQVGVSETRPGTRLSPTVAIDSFGVNAVAKCSMRFTPIVPGTYATLTFTLLEYDNSTTGTVACTEMLATDWHANFNTKPHEYEQHFVYSADNTENLAPISFT
jgi:hypothetical protein